MLSDAHREAQHGPEPLLRPAVAINAAPEGDALPVDTTTITTKAAEQQGAPNLSVTTWLSKVAASALRPDLATSGAPTRRRERCGKNTAAKRDDDKGRERNEGAKSRGKTWSETQERSHPKRSQCE